MTNQSNYQESVERAVVRNTAQDVCDYLQELDSNRRNRHKRWVWELLQNARDVPPDADNSLTVEVRYNPGEPGELVFLHNGRAFKMDEDEIAHLILHGSTKHESKDTLGQFGSGFLTTHLLSWEIQISGLLDDKQWFDFPLVREPISADALYKSMMQAGKDFITSLSPSRPKSIPDGFTTRFAYPIRDAEAEEAVAAGIEALKQYAPYVVVFNKEFASIKIKTASERYCFEVLERPVLKASGIPQQITVTENKNENSREREYLLAAGTEETSVAFPLKSDGDDSECLSIENTPRLFLGFPLVGTEGFSFPAVINSFKFTALEDRDGVPLGQSNNQINRTNQEVIEEASVLLKKMLRFAGSKGWDHVHLLANLPSIQTQNGLNTDWLKESIHLKFIEDIRKTPAVLTPFSKPIEPNQSLLPVAETDAGIEPLWDLLNDWHGCDVKLPRRDEAIGWYKAIQSWAEVLKCEVSEFGEAINGERIAREVDKVSHDPSVNPRTHRVSNLQLKEDKSVINWMDQLIHFLENNGLPEVINQYQIVPSQAEFLRSLPRLHRDAGIDNELKEIAGSLKWHVRKELRDTRLNSVSKKPGKGDMDQDSVVTELLRMLQNRAVENCDDIFREASLQLFAWIVSQENVSLLRNYPVFAADGKSVLELSSADNHRLPLAPVSSWHKDLQPYADLFPPERILDDAFFQKVPDQQVWKQLNNLGIVRTDMIISRETTNLNVLSLDLQGSKEGHEAAVSLHVTDFIERERIMDRVRNTPARGRLFWKFITEYLIKADNQSLETQAIECKSCGNPHNCYPALWLERVRNYQWIILERGSRFPPGAKALANLLRGSDWKLSTMDENHALVEFLKAIGLTPSELRLEFIMDDEERDTVIQKVAEVHQAVGGNWEPIEALAKRIQNDENASENIVRILEAPEDVLNQVVDDLAELREQEQRVNQNRAVGQEVEKWVGENLKDEGFEVKSVHTGADFIIESDLITLDVTQGDRKWWIEVKSARTESVKMSSKQTQNALNKKENFLLCVVPIPENTDLNFETVRKNMQFIKNISKKFGDRVTELCEYIGGQEAVLDNDPDDTSPGLELEGEAGKAEMRVQKSIWESDEAFPLENLTEKLK